MKKSLSIILSLLMIISTLSALPFTAQAAETLTVADGTDSNDYLPIYCTYNNSKDQYIIPASDLSAVAGKQITGLRWYYSDTKEVIRNIKIILCETEETVMTDLVDVSSKQVVFSGNWTLDGNEAFVTFNTPYHYGGSNLLVTIVDNTGTWKTLSSYGTNCDTAAGYYGRSDTFVFDAATTDGGFEKRPCSFVPKTTFTYEESAASEITVADGETTNGYIPFYGFYADAYTKSQYVIPAADLAAMTDSDINSLTCHTISGQEDVDWGVNFDVYLAEVENTTISSFYDVSNATLVYSGNLQIANKKLNVAFDTPYHYNGGNLLVAFENTTLGTYKSATYLGKSATGASISNYSYSSLDAITTGIQRDFIPKTTFTYEASAASEVTVADGTDTQSCVPFFGFYADAYTKSNYVIPAADLTAISNSDINSLTCYTVSGQEDADWGVNFNVYLAEVENTTISSFYDVSNATLVYSGNLQIVSEELNVIFNNPYYYNGGNLLVAFETTSTGDYKSVNYLGKNAEGASISEYSYVSLEAITTGTQRDFIPKTTFHVGTAPATSGTIGDCEWNYDSETKTLTISGEGAMADVFPMPYADYKYEAENVVIEQGVTALAMDAFLGFSNLQNVTLPAGLKKIGTFAFYNCPVLTNLTVPDSVDEIGDDAIGRFWNDVFSRSESIDGFVMKYRCSNEAAKTYAESNGITKELEHDYIEKNTPFNIKKKTGEHQKIYCKDCGNVLLDKTYPCPTDFKLSKTAYTYDGKAKEPTLSYKYDKDKITIPAKYIKYKSNKKVGTATASYDFQNGNVVTLKFKIYPKGTSLSGVTKGKQTFTAKWKAQKTQTTGYELQYSTDKKFNTGSKTVTIGKNSTVKKTVKKLKSGKTYYVRIRTYKTVSKTKYYSDWSKVKSVKVK